MKCTIPEISWHNREPVLSVDLHPDFDPFYRLATGGGDCHVLIWQVIIEESGAIKQEVISDLKKHQRSVNVVKWSPSGQYLASADDDANILIWQLKTDNIPSLDDEGNDKETWNIFKILRGHKEDIYDLCWSPNSAKLLTGSIDNTAILWDLQKGKNEQILTDHKGFVQGVAWDPKDQYIVTISTDRICRIFDKTGKHVTARISKGTLPVPMNHTLYEKEVKYFHDDTFKSFFRRLSFSPDGSILIVPSGNITFDEGKSLNCSLIFPVESYCPIAILPIPKQCSTVVRCCPMYYELRTEGPEPYINLPYRILFAIGTDHDVILYDTQQIAPFARFNNIHYTRLTDLTWSNDGLLLIASSTDGFCTLITFESNELGIQYIKDESGIEDNAMNVSSTTEPMDVVEIPPNDPPPKEKEIPDKNAIRILTPRRIKKPPVAEKNTSILTFFRKTNEPGAEAKNVLVEKQSENMPLAEKSAIESNLNSENTKLDEVIILDDEPEVEEVANNDKLNDGKVLVNEQLLKNDTKPTNTVKPHRRITPSRVS